ncbi:hypothetical protein B0O80DRAFT_486119 [Mortierella sp. GBAus27b]|nr:hypothetical protein B0O80DRAFT_486119 [Mortierella sp. GBAus27b]
MTGVRVCPWNVEDVDNLNGPWSFELSTVIPCPSDRAVNLSKCCPDQQSTHDSSSRRLRDRPRSQYAPGSRDASSTGRERSPDVGKGRSSFDARTNYTCRYCVSKTRINFVKLEMPFLNEHRHVPRGKDNWSGGCKGCSVDFMTKNRASMASPQSTCTLGERY